MSARDIYYSAKYIDDSGFEYRHVILPKEIAKKAPNKLMSESEWRGLGVQQSEGWVNYMRHNPASYPFVQEESEMNVKKKINELQKGLKSWMRPEYTTLNRQSV